MWVWVLGSLNNLRYNLAKILRKRGADAELIQNPHENFAFSRPLWDDCEVVVDAEAQRLCDEHSLRSVSVLEEVMSKLA